MPRRLEANRAVQEVRGGMKNTATGASAIDLKARIAAGVLVIRLKGADWYRDCVTYVLVRRRYVRHVHHP